MENEESAGVEIEFDLVANGIGNDVLHEDDHALSGVIYVNFAVGTDGFSKLECTVALNAVLIRSFKRHRMGMDPQVVLIVLQ